MGWLRKLDDTAICAWRTFERASYGYLRIAICWRVGCPCLPACTSGVQIGGAFPQDVMLKPSTSRRHQLVVHHLERTSAL